MAGNLQVPRDLTDLFEVRPKVEPLRKFLEEVANTIRVQQETIKKLEDRIYALENP